jgi:hypothetical protein
MKSNFIMTVVMLAIFVVMVGIASGYPAGARFMTFVVGIPAIALCLLQLGLDIYRSRAVSVAAGRANFEHVDEHVPRAAVRRVDLAALRESLTFTGTQLDPRERVRRELVVWSYFLGLIATILLLGFRVALPLFLTGFLRFQAKATWGKALMLGLAGSAILLVLFEKVLGVALHGGFIAEHLLNVLPG